jgi:hypothetical protein
LKQNRFQRFAVETVKTVSEELKCLSTGLKPGVNEMIFRQAMLVSTHAEEETHRLIR